MKAVRMIESQYPLQLQNIPTPIIGSNDVLVRVKASGICHTDVHYRAGKSPVHPLPRTLGHEIAGIVEQVGDHVTSVHIGDRVCVHYVLSCGFCYYCRSGYEQFCIQGSMIGRYADGGYAEYVSVPQGNLVLLMIGLPHVMKQAVQSLAVMGRAVIVGISEKPLEIDTYQELLGREAAIIGSNDHLFHELPLLLELTRRGKLKLSDAITHTVPLDAASINQALDNLENFASAIRIVIIP